MENTTTTCSNPDRPITYQDVKTVMEKMREITNPVPTFIRYSLEEWAEVFKHVHQAVTDHGCLHGCRILDFSGQPFYILEDCVIIGDLTAYREYELHYHTLPDDRKSSISVIMGMGA